MDIKGGAIDFEILVRDGKLKSILEESKRRIQDFTYAAQSGGKGMDDAFDKAGKSIGKGFDMIGSAMETNKSAIAALEKKYEELGIAAGNALRGGKDRQYASINQEMSNVNSQISAHKQVVRELHNADDALVRYSRHLNDQKAKTDQTSASQQRLGTQMRAAVNELARMEEAGLRGTEAYKKLQAEAGRLANALGDARTQARILSHDNAGLQGVISAVGGFAGVMSAAQGAVGLFAGENEDLQKIMLKVQSLMAVTMGLQQAANTLNKDSYFTIKILGGIKQWWAGILAKATGAEAADAVALRAQSSAASSGVAPTTANAAATAAQSTAATVGTAANLGLAGAFRAVGIAIKSIPLFGWIAAAIGVLAGVLNHFISKAAEARKATEEFYKAVAQEAGEPVSKIQKLSYQWSKLGDDIKAKEQLIKDQKKVFEDLSASVESVSEAEKLLIGNKDAFIGAQIAKAKALVTLKNNTKTTEELILAEQKLLDAQSKPTVSVYRPTGSAGYYETVTNPEIKYWQGVVDEKTAILEKGYDKIIENEKKAAKNLADAGITGAKEYAEGTVGALENAISEKRKAINKMSTDDKEAIKAAYGEIANLQKQFDGLTGKNDGKNERDNGKAEKVEQKRIDAVYKFAEVQRKIENENIRFKQEIAQKEIDLDEDSFQKKMKQNDLNYEKEKQSIRENEQKLLKELQDGERSEWEGNGAKGLFTPQITVLPEDTKAQINAQYEIAEKAHKEGGKKVLEGISGMWSEEHLRFSGDLKKRIAEIDQYYDDRIKLAKGNEQLIAKLEENRDYEKSYAANEDYIQRGIERIEYEQSVSESILDARKNEFAADSLYNLKKIQLQREYAVKRMELLKSSNAKEGTEEAKKNQEEINTIRLLIENLDTEGRNMVNGIAADALSGISDISDAMSGLDDEFGEAAQNVKMLGSAIGQLAQGNYIGAAVGALSAIITSNIKDHADAIVEAKNREDAYFESVNWKIERQIDLMKELNGLTAENMNDMVLITETVIQDKVDYILNSLREFDWKSSDSYFDLIDKAFGGFQKFMDAPKEIQNAFDKIFSGVNKEQQAGKTTYFDLLEHMTEEEILSLMEMENIWKILPEEVRNYIKSLYDARNQLNELGEAALEMYTGTTGKAVSDSMSKLFEDADLTFEEIGASFEDHMKKAILNVVNKGYMDELTAWYKAFADDMADGTLDKAEFLQQWWKDIAENGNEQMKNALKAAGIDFEDATPATASPLAGAIKGASQEEVNALIGYMYNTSINQAEETELVRDQMRVLTSIDGRVAVSNQFLESIDGKLTTKSDPLRAQGIQ
jgi:hypothetical protein